MEMQRELVFHDTVPLDDEGLQQARKKAHAQKEMVYEMFKRFPDHSFTPPEMFKLITNSGGCAILTSIRRAITDLTKEGRLTKCMWSERRKGVYGTPNRTWKYNPGYIKPLNPKR